MRLLVKFIGEFSDSGDSGFVTEEHRWVSKSSRLGTDFVRIDSIRRYYEVGITKMFMTASSMVMWNKCIYGLVDYDIVKGYKLGAVTEITEDVDKILEKLLK